MIPYEQLVAALTAWRQRQGLPTAPAELFGGPVAAAPAGPAGYRDEIVEMGDDAIVAEEPDEMLGGEATTIGEEPGGYGPS
jgi:hypothetical protein